MTVGVPKERFAGETRVALAPQHIGNLAKAGLSVRIESGCGLSSGFSDDDYKERGAEVDADRQTLYGSADIILTVRAGAAASDEDAPGPESSDLREGQTIIGFLDPYQPHSAFTLYRERNITSFSMELIPRITRAQSMDALSSMANLAGYKAVLIAANALPKMYPMLMTAAGTIVPARVFVVGVGVAGLQAIATAKRLGAIVSAYDVRPAVREQVESLGAKFVEMELETTEAEGTGGYAREMDEDFYRKQREFMAETLREMDVVITTAAIPGRKSPVLVTEEMVEGMPPGSVIVDLAVERGGNCELSRPGETVQAHGVSIIGPLNIPSSLSQNASLLYSRNITSFLTNMIADGELSPKEEDEIVAATLVTRGGEVPNEQTRERLGL